MSFMSKEDRLKLRHPGLYILFLLFRTMSGTNFCYSDYWDQDTNTWGTLTFTRSNSHIQWQFVNKTHTQPSLSLSWRAKSLKEDMQTELKESTIFISGFADLMARQHTLCLIWQPSVEKVFLSVKLTGSSAYAWA